MLSHKQTNKQTHTHTLLTPISNCISTETEKPIKKVCMRARAANFVCGAERHVCAEQKNRRDQGQESAGETERGSGATCAILELGEASGPPSTLRACVSLPSSSIVWRNSAQKAIAAYNEIAKVDDDLKKWFRSSSWRLRCIDDFVDVTLSLSLSLSRLRSKEMFRAVIYAWKTEEKNVTLNDKAMLFCLCAMNCWCAEASQTASFACCATLSFKSAFSSEPKECSFAHMHTALSLSLSCFFCAEQLTKAKQNLGP